MLAKASIQFGLRRIRIKLDTGFRQYDNASNSVEFRRFYCYLDTMQSGFARFLTTTTTVRTPR